MIKSLITSAIGKKVSAEVTEDHAVKVATVEYDEYRAAAKFFQHETYGVDLNKTFSNEAAGNANETIHNGTDTVDWTASAIIGTWDFASTNNPDTGAKNIEIIGATVADTAQFLRASSVTMSAHTGLSGRIYISTTGHNLAELSFYAWDTGTGMMIGNTINIYDYINPLSVGVYQTFTIPLVDMGLIGAVFDAVRFTIQTKSGASFDLDNIVLNDPTGGAAIGTSAFDLLPEQGRILFVDAFIINMAGPLGGTLADATMPYIPYNKLLNVPKLASPIIYQVLDHKRVAFVAPFSQTIDFMQFGNPEVKFVGSDGTNSWITIYIGLSAPILLHDKLKQKMSITLSDDLSALTFFRWSTNCRQLYE